MLSFSGSLEVFVAVEPCDMRRSFNGLHDLVSLRLNENPKSGSIYALTNKLRSLLKILGWDGSGLWVLAKRLSTHKKASKKTRIPERLPIVREELDPPDILLNLNDFRRIGEEVREQLHY